MTYLGVPPKGRRRTDLVIAGVLLVVGGLASGLSRERQSRVEAIVRGTALYPFLQIHRASAERMQIAARASRLQAERDSLVQVASRYRVLAGQALALRSDAGLDSLRLGSVSAAD